MATRKVNAPQTQVVVPAPTTAVAAVPTVAPVLQNPHLTLEIPTSITVKDIVVVATALITIVSSWTFYTMRLSVLDQKILDVKAQVDKANADLIQTQKDVQELKLREQAVEIRQQYKR